jgi:tape measure domain-containing protein
MTDEADFTLALIDDITGPAKRMKRSIDDVSGSMHGIERAAGAGALKGSFLGNILAEVGAAAGRAALQLAKLGAEAVVSFAQAATGAVAFRESSLAGLELITKSPAEAIRAVDETMKLSDRIGTDFRASLSQTQSLLAKGFDLGGAHDVIKAMSDLKVAVPTANIQNAVLAIEQIKAKGVLSMEELQGQLAEAGINVGDVLDAIGKNVGKTSADVRKAISKGEISSDEGVLGILQSITQLTGKPLGQASEDGSKSITKMFERIQGLPTRFFDEVAKGMDSSGLAGILSTVWDAIGPGSAAFKAAVGAVGRIISAFDVLISRIFPDVENNFEAVAGAVVGALGFVADAILFVSDNWETIKSVLTGVIFVIGVGVGQLVMFGAAVVGVFAVISAAIGAIVTFVPQLAEAGSNLARALLDGLANTIGSGAQLVLQAVRNLGGAVIAAVRAVLRIGSPSKVFEEIGGDLTAGMAIGMETTVPKVQGAAAIVGAAATGGAMTGAASAPSAGHSIVFSPTINISGASGDPQKLADDLDRRIRSSFISMLEGAGLA